MIMEMGAGNFGVLDCDNTMIGILEEENLLPADAGRVQLTGYMEERCLILKRLGAKFHGSLEEYEGRSTYLTAWEWKLEGEVRELVKMNWRERER